MSRLSFGTSAHRGYRMDLQFFIAVIVLASAVVVIDGL